MFGAWSTGGGAAVRSFWGKREGIRLCLRNAQTTKWTTNHIAVALQDFIICIEMFFASLVHMYAFRVQDFQECGYAPLLPPHRVLFDVANVSDVVSDAHDVLSSRSDLVTSSLIGRKAMEKGSLSLSLAHTLSISGLSQTKKRKTVG